MKTEPRQNLSIIFVHLEHVEDENENIYIDMLDKKDNNLKTKHYMKSACCKFITETCKELKDILLTRLLSRIHWENR